MAPGRKLLVPSVSHSLRARHASLLILPSYGRKQVTILKKLPGKNDDDFQRGNAAAIAAAIVLVVAVFVLVEIFKSHVLPQNCHMAGFTHCRWPLFPRRNW
jgi:hypothetical protein